MKIEAKLRQSDTSAISNVSSPLFFLSVRALAPFDGGLPESRSRFALCLCMLCMLVFQSTAAEMRFRKKKMEEKYSFHFVSHSPPLFQTHCHLSLSFCLSFSLFSLCVFKVKAAPSLIICARVSVHVRDRKSNDSNCIELCILPFFFFNPRNPSDVIHTSS